MVTADAADVITSSWYDGYIGQVPQSLITAWEGYLDQATAQGISVDFATGDYSDTTALQYPGSDPEITTVGGTSLLSARMARTSGRLLGRLTRPA